MKVQETLRKARDLMNNKGTHWTRNRLHTRLEDGTMAHCALGGLFAAVGKKGGNATIPINARPAALALCNAIRASSKRPPLDPNNPGTKSLWTIDEYVQVIMTKKEFWIEVAYEITSWNDSLKSWRNVRNMFTKAARSPKKYLPKEYH